MGQESVAVLHEAMKRRFSCRSYLEQKLEEPVKLQLEHTLAEKVRPPFGSAIRFSIAGGSGDDAASLKGLGTYGVIRNPAAFIIGAMKESPRNLEDYGYLMQRQILHATALGMGTCWLGGSFTKSTFAERIRAAADESVPAVAALGYIAPKKTIIDSVFRFSAGSNSRKQWSEIFFDGGIGTPLDEDEAGIYREALEMVRMAPSASNRQPWRVIREGKAQRFHFYLCRSGSYGRIMRVSGMADLQRIDMGIAMCHFETAVAALGLGGTWEHLGEPPAVPPECEYSVTWKG
ncbi:MAG: nitroreductase [Spirochaetes bacterium]|nr:nitroreductase [Spirochaetota bacterium]